MIRKIRHKGLRRLYEEGKPGGVATDLRAKAERVLALLDVATKPRDLDLPGYRLHPLRGEMKGFWSVSVSGNWRIVFRFEGDDTTDVDLIDYH